MKFGRSPVNFTEFPRFLKIVNSRSVGVVRSPEGRGKRATLEDYESVLDEQEHDPKAFFQWYEAEGTDAAGSLLKAGR